MASEPRTIDISITSDTICPWCYLGYRKVEKAIETVTKENLPVQFKLHFEPFELDPTLGNRPTNKRERYIKRFGGPDRIAQMEQAMKARGEEYGIAFSYGGDIRQTLDSHRLLAKAYELGGETKQRALVERLFNAYFEREQDIGSHDVLAQAAADAGVLDKDAALRFLATDEGLSAVKQQIVQAQRKGVTGVPFFVLDNKYGISGAQDPDTFAEIFRKLAKGEAL